MRKMRGFAAAYRAAKKAEKQRIVMGQVIFGGFNHVRFYGSTDIYFYDVQ